MIPTTCLDEAMRAHNAAFAAVGAVSLPPLSTFYFIGPPRPPHPHARGCSCLGRCIYRDYELPGHAAYYKEATT